MTPAHLVKLGLLAKLWRYRLEIVIALAIASSLLNLALLFHRP